MSYQYLTIDKFDGYAIVSIDRGDGINALSRQLMRELIAAAESFADDLDTTAVILRGTDRVFSAGADLRDPEGNTSSKGKLIERRHALKIGPDLCDTWERMEQITICAIEGFCIGGGSALSLACDWRVAGASAYMRLPEIPLAMNMSWHSIPRLVRAVGPSRAKLYTVLGEKLTAPQALDWGMIDFMTADGGSLDKAIELAVKVAALPPISVRMSKESINMAANALNQATTFMDRDQFMLSSSSSDFPEAVDAFLNKRDPKFDGG
ncbi:enoyl-CoA hydratase/isomerase family protein [Halieaceae bacterium IMCC14734]|uniref:Enoyl-CoA hydratase/isomerase family protein n=1 Tax=Candidatus Litorirhabdus singularis TaxID=2518993 RepID=A0ABT3TDQ3_9GAMM|nr:enoyl-CoA hydratase/isomerase family protein [Candidatus Litorirhabdus singularis]MCX2980437.1 enoyl-CoA hydratase/isomerase family protein [Candidatus Litorirhabdus singularis]